MYDKCINLLEERGVGLVDIAQCVLYLQKQHHPEIEEAEVIEVIKNVIKKREVQHAIITGITLDKLAESNSLQDDVLRDILINDKSLYGIDEVLAYGICNLYGSIALTNFGYIDREKPLIIKTLNEHSHMCHTFLDDIVGALAAAAASRIAHNAE
jgi:phosphatidylglycerophosphatase A